MHQDESDVTPPALDVVRLSHAYGAKKALDDVSFCIPSGRFTVLLGLNGAGKTTLFSLITHLYDTRAGSIRIFGRDLRRSPGEALRRLGIVFQARTLDLDLSVAQNLAYHAALHGIGRRQAMDRIGVLLAEVDMVDRLHDKAKNLSGGQMRRVEIVRALLHRPSLLLLDEATVGLDIRARADILATIRALVAKTGLSVLWATHLIDEVKEGDDVVILDHGRVLATGGVAHVIREVGAADIAAAFAGLVCQTGVSDPGLAAAVPVQVVKTSGRAERDNVSEDFIERGIRHAVVRPPPSASRTSPPGGRSERPRLDPQSAGTPSSPTGSPQ